MTKNDNNDKDDKTVKDNINKDRFLNNIKDD